jgi:hypothetical protein
MRKCGLIVILAISVSCLADSKKPKLDKFMPPAESHGKAISGYGCDKQKVVAETTSTSKPSSIWTLILWAQYGDDHKRYWQKSYDTYQIPIKSSVKHSGESVGSGAAIGAYESDAYDFGAMDEACNLWGAQVRTTLKVEENGAKVK